MNHYQQEQQHSQQAGHFYGDPEYLRDMQGRGLSFHHPQHHPCYTDSGPHSSAGLGKRQRDSPTSSEGSDPGWQTSFKRLKVEDEGCSTSSARYPTMTDVLSSESRYLVSSSHVQGTFPSNGSNLPSHYQVYQAQATGKMRHHQVTADSQQSAGQQSSEASQGYQPMNSMLGNLHLMRRQRTGSQPPAQHPGPAVEQTRQQPYYSSSFSPMGQPVQRGTPHKKSLFLRTSSKLY